MEKRDQMLKDSLIRFLHHGIRKVKISDLTQVLNVSSKTLYQHFEDKHGLVKECFQLYLNNTTREFSELEIASKDVAELMVSFYRSALEGLNKVNPAFFKDLSTSYSDIWSSEDAFGLLHAKNMIARGIKEEIFVASLDSDLCARTLTNLMRMLLEKEPFSSESPERQFKFVIWPYVRGMCTQKGREKFRSYQS